MKKIIVLALSSLVLWSCNSNSESTESTQEVATTEVHHHDESSEAIQLNSGEKWVINAEMKPFILKGEELVNTYIQNKQTDYKELAKQLKAQNSNLIESCTMDGKSHDELHKWLHPHLELVDKLEKDADVTASVETVAHIQSSYTVFHQYFN